MLIAAFFTIAKIWKQPKHPSTDEWIKKHGETSLVVQGLELCVSSAGGTGSIPGQGLRSHMLCGAAKKKKEVWYIYIYTQ